MQAYLDMTTAVVHKLFGKTHDEAVKQIYPRTGLEADHMAKSYPWGVHQTRTPDGGVIIMVGFKNYSSIIQFQISPYPSCCGSRLFHTFKVDEHRVTQAQLDEVMSALVAENRGEGILGKCNRIEVVMVEQRAKPDGHGYAHTTAMEEPEPVENPKIKYKTLWNFFHKNAKRVRTRLEVNDNTRNVLHNMEVIL